jgi:ATP:ADP antiporter, AAA family
MDDTSRESPPEPVAVPGAPAAGRLKALLAGGGFLFMIAGYSLLKPVRDAVFLQYLGFQRQPMYDVFVALGSLAVVIAYNLVAARVSRRVLAVAGFILFLSGIALCAALLRGEAAKTAAGFYVGLNLSWLLLLAVFWSTVNDVFGVEEGKRWYWLIALAGPFGALGGSALASRLAEQSVGGVDLLWVAFAFMGVAGAMTLALDAAGRRHPPDEPPRVVLQAAFPDVRLLFRSRYVLLLAGIMLFGVFVMKVYTLDFNRLVKAGVPELNAMLRWMANRGMLVNGVGAAVQLAVTPYVLRRYGPRVALVILPLFTMAGGAALGAHEVLAVAFGVTAIGEGLAYTLNQSAKELMYVPGDRSLKYQAKALVDVFCFRLGEVLASLMVLGGQTAFPETFRRTLSPAIAVAVVVSLLWLFTARAAGRAFDEATRGPGGGTAPGA